VALMIKMEHHPRPRHAYPEAAPTCAHWALSGRPLKRTPTRTGAQPIDSYLLRDPLAASVLDRVSLSI
jgi:hypothetical protein